MSSDFVALSSERTANERRVYPRNDNEILVRAANAQLREMAYFKAPFTDIDGKVAGTIGTLVDITERKLAQEALLAEKERAEVTLSSIGDGVITTDPFGAIETINEVAQFLTGFSQAPGAGPAAGRGVQAAGHGHRARCLAASARGGFRRAGAAAGAVAPLGRALCD